MSAGLAIVGTSVGGVPEVVKDGQRPLLAGRTDIVGLGRSIVCVASNATRAREIGTACLPRVADYSSATCTMRILSLYAHVLEPPRSDVL
jgi:glycosyltransferase involved in cell wall biosynthesis